MSGIGVKLRVNFRIHLVRIGGRLENLKILYVAGTAGVKSRWRKKSNHPKSFFQGH